MRRLTREQFSGAARDWFGVELEEGAELPRPSVRAGFRSNYQLNEVTADGVVALEHSASSLSRAAVQNSARWLGGCFNGDDGARDACVEAGLRGVADRAYRRPVSETEHATLLRVYSDRRGAGDTPDEALSATLEVMLQSPQFIYQHEQGASEGALGGSVVPLSDYEIAAKAALLLWDSVPDDALRAAAGAAELSNPATLQPHIERMLTDARFTAVIARFLEDWLELYRLRGMSKDAALFPQWDEALAGELLQEHGAVVADLMNNGRGTLVDLLSVQHSVTSPALARLYGAELASFGKLPLNPSERLGLLTQLPFLASHAGNQKSSPIARGAFVRRNMLCTPIAFPENLEVEPLPEAPGLSVRDALARHRESPVCSGCHALMDPIGFGLEAYDAIGAYRPTAPDGSPIDVSGELVTAGSVSGTFSGGVELSQKLAASELVQECVAQQALLYAFGREQDGESECLRATVTQAFRDSKGDFRKLLLALVTSSDFRMLKVSE
jgi:hypothetical protein